MHGWSVKRKVISNGANVLAQTLLMPGVTDVTGSFRLYRRGVIERVLGSIVSYGYAIQMEMIVRAVAMGAAVVEHPIVFVDRAIGESKLGAAEILRYLKSVIYLFFHL